MSGAAGVVLCTLRSRGNATQILSLKRRSPMSAQTKARRSVEEKYGISKTNGIMLFIQMILVILGLINACLSVYDGVMSGLGLMRVIVAIVDVLAFVAIIHYSVMGFRRQDDLAFIGVIYTFTAALLFKQIAVYDGIFVKLIVGVAFGLSFLFSQRLKDQKFAKGCMNAVCVLLLVSAIILTIQIFTGGPRQSIVPEDELIQMTPEQIANMTPEQLAEFQEMIRNNQSEAVEETETTKTTMSLSGEENEEELKGLDKFVKNRVGANTDTPFRKFIMLCACWSPLLLAGTIALTYHTRMQRAARRKKKAHAAHSGE